VSDRSAVEDPIVLGFVWGADWEYVKPWVWSLQRSGYSGEVAFVTLGCSPDLYENSAKLGIPTIEADPQELLGHHGLDPMNSRGRALARVLEENYRDRFALVTDVRDVFFQRDPIAYLAELPEDEALSLVITPEDLVHDHDSMPGRWNSVKMEQLFSKHEREAVKGLPVYNAGVVGGLAQLLAGVFELIFLICFATHRPGGDQAAFNRVIRVEPFRSDATIVSPSEPWVAHFGAIQFADVPEERKPRIEDGLVKTPDGRVVHILHQYERSREVRRLVSERLAEWEGAGQEAPSS
jgi:hypothetical protein